MKEATYGFILLILLSIGTAWGAAVPVSPGDGTVIGQTCPTFSWSSLEGASSYTVEVFEQQSTQILSYDQIRTISAPVLSFDAGAPALSWTPSSGSCLKTGVSYVWYVGAKDSENVVIWSSGKGFEIDSVVLSAEQNDAVQKAVKAYLSKETSPAASGPVATSSSSAVAGPFGSGVSAAAGTGEGIREAQIMSGIPGVEIANTLAIPYANGTTQLVIGDANYSTWYESTNLSIGSSTGPAVVYIGQSTESKGGIAWNYDANPALAYFGIGTYLGDNPLVLQPGGGGNVGIGATSPSERLEVSGNVKAGNFLYGTAQSKRLTMTGAGFQPYSTSNTYAKTSGIITSATGSYEVPVHFPDGAVITSMTVHFHDNSAQNFNVELRRLDMEGNLANVASFTTSGAVAVWRTGSGTISALPAGIETVDNTFAYDLFMYGMDGTASQGLGGVAIEYTVSSP